MKTVVSFAESLRLKDRPDAHLLLTKQTRGFDVEVISFSTRKALESFNKKAGLRAVVPTQVPRNCAIWAHESDSDARASEAKA